MKKLDLKAGTLVVSNQGLFYKVVIFNENDVILSSLSDGEAVNLRYCFSGSPSADEIYRLFLFNFRPLAYQVGEDVIFYGKDTDFTIVHVFLQGKNLVFEWIVRTTNQGIFKAYQTTFTYPQLMEYNI